MSFHSLYSLINIIDLRDKKRNIYILYISPDLY